MNKKIWLLVEICFPKALSEDIYNMHTKNPQLWLSFLLTLNEFIPFNLIFPYITPDLNKYILNLIFSQEKNKHFGQHPL